MAPVLSWMVLCSFGILAVSSQVIRRENPCDRKSGHSAHEEYCDRYYDCVGDDEVAERSCPNGLVYAGRRALVDVCGYEHEYPCGNRRNRNPPVPTEHCDWLYGIFGHETSCTRYWTCWNGTATEQYCIGGLLFNEQTHSCDWPEFVQDCQKHPLCKDDPNGNVPLGSSCERYWSCQGGYPRLMRCPATLVFDQRSRRCVHPPTDDCDIPPTESPVDAEEEKEPIGNGGARRPIFVAASGQQQQQQQQQQLQQQQPVSAGSENVISYYQPFQNSKTQLQPGQQLPIRQISPQQRRLD